MSLKSHHQSILVARNINRIVHNNQNGGYKVTDTYLAQIAIIKPNGSEEITHNCMYEKEYTIESMEKLSIQDKSTYKNHDSINSVCSQQTFTFDVTETKPISLVKTKPINLNETLFDVLGKMYPRSIVIAEHIKRSDNSHKTDITHEQELIEKVKKLAHEEAEQAIRNMKRNETYKQLGKY